MKIHALTTGTVDLKEAFLKARPGLGGKLALFRPGEWIPAMPIHVWVIEHDGRRILVDTGETAAAHDIPFARFNVTASDELPAALGTIGLTASDVDTVVLTHAHGDHIDGAVHVEGNVLVAESEWKFQKSLMGRISQRISRAPLPSGVEFRSFALGDGAFGTFDASHKLTEDGRVVVVPTPGHTPGHVSIVAIDDEGRHVFIAGDATDSLEQLQARRADAVTMTPKVMVQSIDRILAYAREHPTVYLPAHDPESVSRLEAGTLLSSAR
jgi:glyoxylase-like metal-dependent hydrolase (beta-lactamase superfamily II)